MVTDPGNGPGSAPELSLEQALERLESITHRLESGELELTEALALYEEGVRLVRLAEGVLGAAEQKIQQLRPDGERYRLDPPTEQP